MPAGIIAASRLLGLGGGGPLGDPTAVSDFKGNIYSLGATTGLTVDDLWEGKSGWTGGGGTWVSSDHVASGVGYGSLTDTGPALTDTAYDAVCPGNAGFVVVVIATFPSGGKNGLSQQLTWLDLDFDPESYVFFGPDLGQLGLLDPNDDDSQYPDPGFSFSETVKIAMGFDTQNTYAYTPGTGLVTAHSSINRPTGWSTIGWAPYIGSGPGTASFVTIEKMVFFAAGSSLTDAYAAVT